MAKANSDKHIIQYETKSRSGWISQTIAICARVRLGPVLKEMRAQNGLIRNVELVQSTA